MLATFQLKGIIDRALTYSVKALDFLDVGEMKFTAHRRLESGETHGA